MKNACAHQAVAYRAFFVASVHSACHGWGREFGEQWINGYNGNKAQLSERVMESFKVTNA
jgi:hypothetical protein